MGSGKQYNTSPARRGLCGLFRKLVVRAKLWEGNLGCPVLWSSQARRKLLPQHPFYQARCLPSALEANMSLLAATSSCAASAALELARSNAEFQSQATVYRIASCWDVQAAELGRLFHSEAVTVLAWLHLLCLDLWQARSVPTLLPHPSGPVCLSSIDQSDIHPGSQETLGGQPTMVTA